MVNDGEDIRTQVIEELVRVRKEENVTQIQLAKKINVQQSNISRFERGHSNPSLEFLNRIANGLGRKLKIEFVKEDQ